MSATELEAFFAGQTYPPKAVLDKLATQTDQDTALRVGAPPAPRGVAGSLNRTSAIRLASALRVTRRRCQRCYTSLRLDALEQAERHFPRFVNKAG
jgi:hypothetical protein